MTPVGALRRLGRLLDRIETETVFGGRTTDYVQIATLWLAIGSARPVERSPSGRGTARDTTAPERLEQTAQAEAREHPLAARGQRLLVDGNGWRIVAVDRQRPAPGRMILSLIRD